MPRPYVGQPTIETLQLLSKPFALSTPKRVASSAVKEELNQIEQLGVNLSKNRQSCVQAWWYPRGESVASASFRLGAVLLLTHNQIEILLSCG